MNFILTRGKAGLYGVFGQIQSEDGTITLCTLEHAYPVNAGFIPKVLVGKYECVRHPPNRLPYETFMLLNVPPFQGSPVDGILIHKGNTNNDSVGCILLGLSFGTGCILESKIAFERFMTAQTGVDKFTLVVQ